MLAETDDQILQCQSVMRHLRDVDASTFLRAVRSQQEGGYRLIYLSVNGVPQAVAGFRLGSNLAWGRHLYVDDLVTIPEVRSKGYGSALLAWLEDFAEREGCKQVHLDSGTERKDAHRFYEREGFEVSSLHFKRLL